MAVICGSESGRRETKLREFEVFKVEVVVRSAERSQDSAIGTCDAQRDWWSAFDMLNRYLS